MPTLPSPGIWAEMLELWNAAPWDIRLVPGSIIDGPPGATFEPRAYAPLTAAPVIPPPAEPPY